MPTASSLWLARLQLRALSRAERTTGGGAESNSMGIRGTDGLPQLKPAEAGRYAPVLALARLFLADKHADLLLLFQNLRRLADLRGPSRLFPSARQVPRHICAHVGPPNSGKTAGAVEALVNASTGCYLAPLRLLAWEVYVKLKKAGKRVALVTGQERHVCPDWTHLCCTVEIAPLDRRFTCAVLDEAQLLANSQRGDAWTNALLGMQADELHVCSEARAAPLVEKLATACADRFTIRRYERLSPLRVDDRPLARLEDLRTGDCLLCFTRVDVLRLKRKLEGLGFDVCAVYGHLPPSVKQRQARKFNAAVAEAVAAEAAAAEATGEAWMSQVSQGALKNPQGEGEAPAGLWPLGDERPADARALEAHSAAADASRESHSLLRVLRDLRPGSTSPSFLESTPTATPPPPSTGSRLLSPGDRARRRTVLISTDAVGMGLNLEIRRVVFWKMSKFSGSAKRPLTVAELRQLGGRAGRRGRLFGEEGGRVSCMEGEDFHRLTQAFDDSSPIPPLKQAALLPSVRQLLLFCDELKRSGLAGPRGIVGASPSSPSGFASAHLGKFYEEALQLFCDLVRVDADFFVPLHKLNRMLTVLHALSDIPLSRQQRFTFALAPLPVAAPAAFLKDSSRKRRPQPAGEPAAAGATGCSELEGDQEDPAAAAAEAGEQAEPDEEEDAWLIAEAEQGIFFKRVDDEGLALAAGLGAGLSPLVLGAVRTFAVLLSSCGVAPLPQDLRFCGYAACGAAHAEGNRETGGGVGDAASDPRSARGSGEAVETGGASLLNPGQTEVRETLEASTLLRACGESPSFQASLMASLGSASGEEVGDADLRDLEERLSQLEQLYQILDLYRWLSFKYPHAFLDASLATESQRHLTAAIESHLTRVSDPSPALAGMQQLHPESGCHSREAGELGLDQRQALRALSASSALRVSAAGRDSDFFAALTRDKTGLAHDAFLHLRHVEADGGGGGSLPGKHDPLLALLAASAVGRQLFDGASNPGRAFSEAVQGLLEEGRSRGMPPANGCMPTAMCCMPPADAACPPERENDARRTEGLPFCVDVRATVATPHATARMPQPQERGDACGKADAETETERGRKRVGRVELELDRLDESRKEGRVDASGGGQVAAKEKGTLEDVWVETRPLGNSRENASKLSRLLREISALTCVNESEAEKTLEEVVLRLRSRSHVDAPTESKRID
ncbi:hypothetical protein BESB_009040 [Besnoitia besnoiti]|uniref:Helicase C-terminal domain-containing protein n=1 Tax=Besnoitia besnoiti TaxID=94643 RepID=A0A2A9MQX9_BESBE|nr:hypothetical protein BESB_009040 [Besnoitia besnoiti]PFH38562.1 hypothetical protein BESB_009040 [Besnoitia besnoiti]